MAKAVILKKVQNTEIGYLYVIVPAKESDIEECNRLRDISPDLVRYCIEQDLCFGREQIDMIFHCGKLSNFTSYEKLVYKFKLTRRQIEQGKREQYRCYNFSIEDQKKSLHLVTLASNALISWRSAMSAAGSNYGLIIRIKYNIL